MLLRCKDDFARYAIHCPPGCEVKLNEGGIDFLIVPDPDDAATPYVILWDDLLLEAARSGEFDLGIASIEPLN